MSNLQQNQLSGGNLGSGQSFLSQQGQQGHLSGNLPGITTNIQPLDSVNQEFGSEQLSNTGFSNQGFPTSQGGQGFSGTTQNVQSSFAPSSKILSRGLPNTGSTETYSAVPLSTQGVEGMFGGSQNLQSGTPFDQNVLSTGTSNSGLSGQGSFNPLSGQGSQGLSGGLQNVQSGFPTSSNVQPTGVAGMGYTGTGAANLLGSQGTQGLSGTGQNVQSGMPFDQNTLSTGQFNSGLSGQGSFNPSGGQGSFNPLSGQGSQGLSGTTQGLQSGMPVDMNTRTQGLSGTGLSNMSNPSQVQSHFTSEG